METSLKINLRYMEIKTKEAYKLQIDSAQDRIYRLASDIKDWRHNHPDADEGDVNKLIDLNHELGRAREELKSGIKNYYGIYS